MKHKSIFAPVNILLLVLNLVLLNLISQNLFGRLDLTDNRVYTLSKPTKNILRNLDETLTIKAYFTRDLPIPYNNIARYVEDQLAEMRAYSKGHLRYEFRDPADEEQLKKEAEKFRLEPMQVNEMHADKVELKLAYMGMVLIYEDRQEVIPVVQSLENLEYEIVSKIKRITADETKTIGFVSGHDEPQLSQDMTRLDRELRKMYDVKQVDFSLRYTVPEDIDLLLLVSPKKDLSERDRFAIDQFLMRGGKVMMCLNKVAADLQTMTANRGPLRIDPWTENYGFRINDDLVVDRRAPTLPFQTMTRYGRQITYVVYPLFPEVVNFDRDLIPLKVLRQVRLYFPSSIDTTLAGDVEGVSLTPLLWSSEKAGLQMQPFDINPLTQRGKLIFDQQNIPMWVLLQGVFTSFWEGKEIPKDDDGNPVTDEELLTKSPDTRMVVISDGNFLQDQFIVPGLDNIILALNLIDWLVQDEDLISIRSKEVGSRPLAEVSDATRRTVKYASMLIPPLLIIGFGLLRWRLRNAARRTALRNFGGVKPGGDQK